MPRKLLVAILVLAIPFVLAACGDDEETTSASSPETTAASSDTTSAESTTASGGGETVAITETDFKIDPADPTVKAGTVTFDITNDGGTTHDLEVEGDGVEEVSDTIEPGGNTQLTVDLQPGTYEMYCTIDGHEGLGMKGEVTVQ